MAIYSRFVRNFNPAQRDKEFQGVSEMVRPARFERATYRFVVTWLPQQSQQFACQRTGWVAPGLQRSNR